MPLILQVTRYRNQPPAVDLSCVFSAEGGVIGRAVGSDLELEDPGKYISRAHARIHQRSGLYYLTDTGSNPSIVNDRPLGNGREAALENGDRIVIGDYQIVVAVYPDVEAQVEDPSETLNMPPPFVPPPVAVPAPLPPLEVSPPLPRQSEAPPATVHDALADPRVLGSLLDVGVPFADPLGLSLFDDGQMALPSLGGPRREALMPAFRGAESDHLAPQFQAFTLPPRVVPVEPVLPPADEPVAAVQMIPAGYDPLTDLLQPLVSPAPAPTPRPMPLSAVLVAPAEPQQAPEDIWRVAESEVVAPLVEPLGAAQPALKPTAPTATDDAVLQALLNGLGLPNLRSDRAPAELAQLVGAMLREAIGGTMDVLMARALTKRESHIDMTMIGAHSNNPLKFFPDPDSALTQMLSADAPAYLKPVKALDGAFDDLKAHELAVIAGMRAALGAVVKRFDPHRIEQRLATPGRLDRLLPGSRKARLWDRLVESYGDLARDADEDLQRLFGEMFSVAYEEQVARLRDKP
ncbi:type VI secretion system-associated FHA domain protein TagH [Pseudomonas gingeri]|uniref:type VI secretion system-associated FHA domain protein TagH n=1 Tax=Pseudomonas gingeri TaxID=117681 RepID=UPI0015A47FBD|nr:type VI secretion system-associated FHA domain protein TagH [Pseudomonas gingeri]NWD04692.1 type VI secretion system-associated FHA domain protein TagH [Pseudomonas gingeri]NWE30942.1 type VI secretion system-associated FHA domain protein TagH [Pseudomonas gingeri]NWE59004.1 type VI secretion system-associated FHA domain protein TagH [Pseudomonas gingeri]NWF02408.1 type VI secretion system-associated FHA domain protein TagH [Pseudomonas gingeri]